MAKHYLCIPMQLDLPSGYLDAMADIAPLHDRDFAPGQPYEIDA